MRDSDIELRAGQVWTPNNGEDYYFLTVLASGVGRYEDPGSWMGLNVTRIYSIQSDPHTHLNLGGAHELTEWKLVYEPPRGVCGSCEGRIRDVDYLCSECRGDR